MSMYGLSGALKNWVDAIEVLEMRRERLSVAGAYDIGLATREETDAVDRAEEHFVAVLRELLTEVEELEGF